MSESAGGRPAPNKALGVGGRIARAKRVPPVALAVTNFVAAEADGASRASGAQDGGAGGAPIVLLHGFTGNAESMRPLAEQLLSQDETTQAGTAHAGTAHADAALADAGRGCLGVDLVGHGDTASPPDVGRYSLESFAASLDIALAAALPDSPVHLVGYSLGGRAALTYASLQVASQPRNRLASLTLIGASAGIAETDQRIERRSADFALARRIAEVGVRRFVDEWTAAPMWDSLRERLSSAAWEASLAQRRANHPLGLAHSLRAGGAGAMTPLWDKLGEMEVATLVLTGAEDEKFCATGEAMVAGLCGEVGGSAGLAPGRFVAVPEAGHAAHLEQPAAVARLILNHIEHAERTHAAQTFAEPVEHSRPAQQPRAAPPGRSEK